VEDGPDQPTERKEGRDEELTSCDVGGIVVDDRCRTDHDNKEPDTCLACIGEVSEQHRREHSRDRQRGLAHDEPSVDEGQGGAHHPRQGRGEERGPATQQQAEDHQPDHHRLERLPKGAVRVLPSGPQQSPDGSRDGEDNDQGIQAAGCQERPGPAHPASL
jgi:hypothetical protein